MFSYIDILKRFFFWKNSVDFWHRKLTLKVQFLHFLTNHNSSLDCFKTISLSMLILRQKSCILRPTIQHSRTELTGSNPWIFPEINEWFDLTKDLELEVCLGVERRKAPHGTICFDANPALPDWETVLRGHSYIT